MGVLITVEGGEFTGKTSLIVPALKRILQELKISVLTSREPGGTPKGEEMRNHIFKRLSEGADQFEIAPLMNQARRLHLDEVIIPFLGEQKEKNGVVILDRYADCTIVYQGLQGGVPMERIIELEKEYVRGYYPDITLITYFPEEKFTQTFSVRKKFAEHDTSRSKNKWDEGEIDHHITRQRYHFQIPDIYKQFHIQRKHTYIDASVHPKKVIEQVIKAVQPIIEKAYPHTNLVSTFEKLWDKGTWKEIESMWDAQQDYLHSKRVK